MSPFADRIFEPDEEAFIHAMMPHVPAFIASVERGNKVAGLVTSLHQHAENHHRSYQEFENAVFTAINELRPDESLGQQDNCLAASCHGDHAYIRELRLYGGVLSGVQYVIFSRIFDTLARLEPGDPTPQKAAENLTDALYRVPGLGKHEAELVVRNLEQQVDQAISRCLGSRGR